MRVDRSSARSEPPLAVYHRARGGEIGDGVILVLEESGRALSPPLDPARVRPHGVVVLEEAGGLAGARSHG